MSWPRRVRRRGELREAEGICFWAVLLERQDDDPDRKGSYLESAEGNIEAEFWSKTRGPARETGSTSSLQGLLPESE